ncbi:MAG: sensor histidine kinase [Rubripirellula sp.]
MLKRRKIRTKLKVALTLLSAIVLLLAFSGFWGLYHYRKLGKAVSQLAEQIPKANQLDQLARTMRESDQRLGEYLGQGGMIGSEPLGSKLVNIGDIKALEVARFRTSRNAFERELESYEQAIAIVNADSLLVDTTQQAISLRDIRALHEDISSRLRESLLEAYRFGSIETELDELVSQTETHLGMIHEGMESFSKDVHGQYRTWITLAWSCLILALVIVGVLLWSFHFLIVKPFTTLVEGSRLVARQQFFDHRIDLGTGDELAELAEAMNDMTDRFQGALTKVNSYCTDLDRQVRERTREVIQNEQLASVGFLAAGVAHEINNPLAAIAWSAESLASRVSEIAILSGDARVVDDELSEALQTNLRRIEDEAYRCKGITEKLLDFSRLSEVRRASTNIQELVSDVVAMVGTVGQFRCKTIRTHLGTPVFAEVNQQEIRQVVLNLVTNALESVDTEGAVDIYVEQTETCASVVVMDDGCGMTQDVMDHLFEPFFTRRRDGTGTGLGLSITYRIVSQHGGSLNASSDGEGQGSRMELLLPITPENIDNIGIGPNTLGPNNPASNRIGPTSNQDMSHESRKAA